ncbi:unnamed protein product [Cuscuta campestris]|uniref:Uncharacterized protein n=1 Tax=Cuscuta campestris TaxID=132261 RepID=A0A484NLJ8_9ASTE|nr:unnamed protein product [Cuscuta campestris]
MEEKKEFATVGLVPGLHRNEILVCQFAARINTHGCVWEGRDVLPFALPVVFAQLIDIFIVTRAIHFLLNPLHRIITPG